MRKETVVDVTVNRRGRRQTTALVLAGGLVLAAAVGGYAWFANRAGEPTRDEPETATTTTLAFVSEVSRDLPEAVAAADAIVLGTVDAGRQTTRRGSKASEQFREAMRAAGYSDKEIDEQDASFDDDVFTDSAFSIERTLKGELSGGSVNIRTLGGELKGHRMNAVGPQLQPGVRHVVFLEMGADGEYAATCVYRITGKTASTDDQGRHDRMPLDELLAVIEAHKADPDPDPRAPLPPPGADAVAPQPDPSSDATEASSAGSEPTSPSAGAGGTP